MKKKIGVFIGEIAQPYQKRIAQSVTERANSLGYDVLFFCSYGSYNEDILYAEGEKAIIYIPDCSLFEGIIITEDVLDIPGMGDELYAKLRETTTCPIVYLRTAREGCYNILLENRSSIEEMTRHFTDVHGFTDICYMSGKKGTEDSLQRLSGFLDVMQEKGIEVTDHMIFHGDYWRNKGVEAVNWFMEGRDSYPQAIICANDYMALSVCEELGKRGVKIPEEVCVSGFDFIEEAREYTPTLTSLEVDFENMAYRAVDVIDAVSKKSEPSKIQYLPAKIRLHKSCGCGTQYRFNSIKGLIEVSHIQTADTKNTLISVADYQDAFDFDEYMTVADKYRRFIRAPKAYFCFEDAEEDGYNEVENDSALTSNVILRRIFDDEKPAERLFIPFPRRKILPDEYMEEEKFNNLCVFAIHFKNVVYGYMVTTLPDKDNWFDIYTQGYLMILANAIANVEVHKKMERLEAIRAIYQKDALTGIFNRRGFDKLLQNRYSEYNKDSSKSFGLVSIDMDNLKTINDNYGHSEGDKALMAIARALSNVMKNGDFCARVGGDEFAAVISISYPGRGNEFKRELRAELKRQSLAFPQYNVEASIGICECTEHDATSLVACVQIADARMYEDKRARKKERTE